MGKSYLGKSVIIIGASGGLGSSFAKKFADQGARLLLIGRNEEKLQKVAHELAGDITQLTFDLIDLKAFEKLSDCIKGWSDHIDIVVNASGYDVRKSLEDHTYEEIQNTFDINLVGSILITKILLPLMKRQKGSRIVHVGGFADGRMAFPYYSVDAASRAGLFTFIEAINRELKLERQEIRVSYFCPSPAETAAERPFHPLWKQMGISILSTERVADALIRAIEKKKTVHIMGGFLTILFAKLNSISPKIADAIVMKKYGRMLQEFLYGKKESEFINSEKQKSKLPNRIALILVVLSFVLYGLIAAVPFLPIPLSKKTLLVPLLVGSGEITWWVGVAIVGKQVVTKYRKYLNACTWFSCRNKQLPND